MASVKVAVRVRPFNQRERDMHAKLIVQMDGKKTRLLNSKEQNDANRERSKDFTFDHSYWSYDGEDAHYASQEQVFSDLGLDVIDSAFEGYNACVFAYGQTGSGKTFTMMGSPDNQGLIPRICRALFSRVAAGKESGSSYRTEVSYLEIYNERVKDLLANDAGHSLRVREHPKLGPYVQDLSRHLVSDYDDIQECMHRGNLQRTTASTQMNDVSSRSHAIFTITFVQASYLRHNNMPSETVSKVHLVDLAGSERADATGATGQRLVEGAHINKSLVTLGSVISALAESSQLQPNDARTPKGSKKNVFIPYRDSVLTWLLKDSLGGNSKTIMIAAISPADCNYGETLSTLRYANRAKNIINKPTINEDPNVKLIRELREEIEKLRAQITVNSDPIDTESGVLATLQRKEAQEKVLTEKWTEKWRETQQILQEQKALGLRKSGLGVVLDSDMPHLVGIDDNLLSTGVTLYHLKEGDTLIGSRSTPPAPDILVTGPAVLPVHCRISLHAGVATLHPLPGAQCWLNTVLLDKPAKLSQGCILLLGRTNMFRYNDPAEAAKLRQEGNSVAMNLSRLSLLSWSTTDLAHSTDNLNNTSDVEGEVRCERIELQRAELQRERELFIQQQEERQQRWRREREELIQAQRKLDEERTAMERSYAQACRRLSVDWRQLSAGWRTRRQALRARQREIAARAVTLTQHHRLHATAAETEQAHLAALQRQVDGKTEDLEAYIRSTVHELISQGHELPQGTDEQSVTSTESLMRLLEQCEPATASSIRDTVEQHKKELSDLETDLQIRAASVASHRAKLERLQAELTLLAAQERGLRRALAEDLRDRPHCASPTPVEGVKRSKSELTLRPSREEDDDVTLSADEREEYRKKRMSLSLSLDPLTHAEDSFHTATSDIPPLTPLPPLSPVTPLPPPPPLTPLPPSQQSSPTSTDVSMKGGGDMPRRSFHLGPRDDSDLSSADEGCRPRIIDGQSSSSVDRSPEERHQRAKYRRRLGDRGRRQVTEAEALRAMQRLCSRIAAQKLLVISSLENDCSKEDLNRQIAVLQDLQKKYVRLEMALQYSFFDSPERRTAVTPIQETPSLTLSESDVLESQASDVANDNHVFHDPLLSRLKECELEASDNVSTSNDEHSELHSEWSDDLSRRGRNDALAIPRTISDGLTHPIDFDRVISIPGWVTRGAGASTHQEYEVRVTIGDERWTLLRRYRRFRELYITMKHQNEKVSTIPFPPRQVWGGAGLARARRGMLEVFLRRLLALTWSCERGALTPHALRNFSPFFRKGVFESGKCGTG